MVVSGVPPIPGDTVLEQREYFMAHMDHYRTLLLTEPRGYPCQNANVIVPASRACPSADFGFLILEQGKIYPAMSGHNCICVATVLLETGMVPMATDNGGGDDEEGGDAGVVTKFQLEAPLGAIDIEARCAHGKVGSFTRCIAIVCLSTLASQPAGSTGGCVGECLST